jgi:hypothetical protein
MYWLIPVILLIIFLLWILLVPVILYLDTPDNRYFVSLPGIIKASIVPSGELFLIQGRVFFFPFRFDPFKARKKKKVRKEKKIKKKKKSKKRSFSLSLVRDLFRKISVRKFSLDIDTDDFMLNARLIPLFSLVNSENIQLSANFEGKASLVLDMRTRIGSLLMAFIKHQIK